jgi:hypothetical protein
MMPRPHALEPAARHMVAHVLHHAHLWLGGRWRRLLIAPVLAAALATAETMLLVLVARLLLAFAEAEPRLTFGSVSLSFQRAVWLAASSAILAMILRVVEARFTTRLAAAAVGRARDAILTRRICLPSASKTASGSMISNVS